MKYRLKLIKMEEIEQVGLTLLRNGYTVTLIKEKIDGKRATYNYYLEYFKEGEQ